MPNDECSAVKTLSQYASTVVCNWYLISGEGDCGEDDCGEDDCWEADLVGRVNGYQHRLLNSWKQFNRCMFDLSISCPANNKLKCSVEISFHRLE